MIYNFMYTISKDIQLSFNFAKFALQNKKTLYKIRNVTKAKKKIYFFGFFSTFNMVNYSHFFIYIQIDILGTHRKYCNVIYSCAENVLIEHFCMSSQRKKKLNKKKVELQQIILFIFLRLLLFVFHRSDIRVATNILLKIEICSIKYNLTCKLGNKKSIQKYQHPKFHIYKNENEFTEFSFELRIKIYLET